MIISAFNGEKFRTLIEVVLGNTVVIKGISLDAFEYFSSCIVVFAPSTGTSTLLIKPRISSVVSLLATTKREFSRGSIRILNLGGLPFFIMFENNSETVLCISVTSL